MNFYPKLTHPYVLLETAAPDKENKSSFLFTDFIDILTFRYKDNPGLFFKKIENYLKKGYWLSGYFSYEFGYYLEPALSSLRQKNNLPLVWLGVTREPIISDSNILKKNKLNTYTVSNIRPSIVKKDYYKRIKKIKHYLEDGLSYQVNFTFKIKFDFKGNENQLYLDLKRAQPTAYSALINTGQEKYLSFSPELFFRIDKKHIITRPMKGTVQRGFAAGQDEKVKIALKKSKKIRAENLMIVDLLRNDLGKVSRRVWAPELFNIEKYKTLYQMTSTIKASPKKNLSLKELFSSLFPCGSVTGAPKIKTMEIIKELEKEPRGIYTGAIGYISPENKSCFNVAIRTLKLEKNKGEIGVGGGIVWDSGPKAEYNEAILKGKFFMQGFSKTKLIESILWTKKDGYLFLNLHLKRLKKSAGFFCVSLDIKKLKAGLSQIVVGETKKLKVRAVINKDGSIVVKKELLVKKPSLVKVILSSKKIDSNNCFLYHKTNQRRIYDRERKKANKNGFFEVIFLNERGEITEGSITNIFIKKNGQFYTPSVKCGLLPGILRETLIKKGNLKEKTLYPKDLETADKIYIGNSVQGLIPATVST